MQKLFMLFFLVGFSYAQTMVLTPSLTSTTSPVTTPNMIPSPTSPVPASNVPGQLEFDKGFEFLNIRDFKNARDWFEKAKQAGNIEAEYEIYVLDHFPDHAQFVGTNDITYISESVTNQDDVKSGTQALLEITLRSANQGNVRAEGRLWGFYSRDKAYLGYPQNMAEGLKWLRKAAEQGDPSSEDALGQFYEQGPEIKIQTGLPKDMVLARHWYELAAAQGWSDAKTKVAQFDSENEAVTCWGFIGNQLTHGSETTQRLELEKPVTLGNPIGALLLCPIQKTETYMPYAKITGNIHWTGWRPMLKINSVEIIQDQGSHFIDHITEASQYVPDMVLVMFKEDTPENVMSEILSKMGDSTPLAQRLLKNNFSIKLRKGMSVKDALKILLNNPNVESAEPDQIRNISSSVGS